MNAYERILVPIDLADDSSATAAERAVQLAAPGATINLVNVAVDSLPAAEVYPSGVPAPTPPVKSPDALDELVSRLSDLRQDVRIDGNVIEGHPAEEIIDRSKYYDLIAMGGGTKNKLARMILGSTAHAVVQKADCAVLIERA